MVHSYPDFYFLKIGDHLKLESIRQHCMVMPDCMYDGRAAAAFQSLLECMVKLRKALGEGKHSSVLKRPYNEEGLLMTTRMKQRRAENLL